MLKFNSIFLVIYKLYRNTYDVMLNVDIVKVKCYMLIFKNVESHNLIGKYCICTNSIILIFVELGDEV